jgi:8-oxo-dGTP diphosphatase
VPEPHLLSIVCVDVVALSYRRDDRRVVVGVHRRDKEPFTGKPALPGVVVTSGERLRDAALRALTKLGLGAPDALGQLLTFDELARDPRGPSLSIAMWAVFDDTAARNAAHAQWITFDAVPKLAFDHTAMVVATRSLLADKLWRDTTFTRALTGPVFSATDAVAITEQLDGSPPHRANLNRDLAKNPNLTEAGTAAATGGRPPKLWKWLS